MATSLSQQLGRLRPQETVERTRTGVVKYASLLFTRQKAQDIDLGSLHYLAANGLASLKRLNSDFERFEDTLFVRELSPVRRGQMNEPELAKLDDQIEAFLILSAPYFLLKPTAKCLEYLIRRYSIHIFNVPALVGAYIPYVSTPLFARLVLILEIRNTDSSGGTALTTSSPLSLGFASLDLAWLRNVRKTGVPLQRTVLIQWCLKDLATLGWIAACVTHVLKVVPGFATGSSFLLSILSGVVTRPKRMSETLMAKLVPIIVRGATSGVPDLVLASFMILSQIAARTVLSPSLLASTLTLLGAGISSSHSREAIHTLAVLCASQGLTELPYETTLAILKSHQALGASAFPAHLVRIASSSSGSLELATILAGAFMASCASTIAVGLKSMLSSLAQEGDSDDDDDDDDEEEKEEKEEMLVDAVAVVVELAELFPSLSDEAVRNMVSPVLSHLGSVPPHGLSETLQDSVSSLLQMFSLRYGNILESMLDGRLKAARTSNDETALPSLSAWIDLAMPSSLRVTQLGESSLFFALNSSSSELRSSGLSALSDILSDPDRVQLLLDAEPDSIDAKEREFVVETFHSALADEDADIVVHALASHGLIGPLPLLDVVENVLGLLSNVVTRRKTARTWSSKARRKVTAAALELVAYVAPRLAQTLSATTDQDQDADDVEDEERALGIGLSLFHALIAHLSVTSPKDKPVLLAALSAADALASVGVLPEFAALTQHKLLGDAVAKNSIVMKTEDDLDAIAAVVLSGLASGLTESPLLAPSISAAAADVSSPLLSHGLPLMLASTCVLLERIRLANVESSNSSNPGDQAVSPLTSTLLGQVFGLVRKFLGDMSSLDDINALSESDLARGAKTRKLASLARVAVSGPRALASLAVSLLQAVAAVAEPPSLAPIYVAASAALPPSLFSSVTSLILTRIPSETLLSFVLAPLQLDSLEGIDPTPSESSLRLVHIRSLVLVLDVLKEEGSWASVLSAKVPAKGGNSPLATLITYALLAVTSPFPAARGLGIQLLEALKVAGANPEYAPPSKRANKGRDTLLELASQITDIEAEIFSDRTAVASVFSTMGQRAVSDSLRKKERKAADTCLHIWSASLFAVLGAEMETSVARIRLVSVLASASSQVVYATGGSKLLGSLAGGCMSRSNVQDKGEEALLVAAISLLSAPGVPRLMGAEPEPFVGLLTRARSASVVLAAIRVLSQTFLDDLPSDSQRISLLKALMVADGRAKTGRLDEFDAHISVPRAIMELLHSLHLQASLLESLIRDATSSLSKMGGSHGSSPDTKRARSTGTQDVTSSPAENGTSSAFELSSSFRLPKVLEWMFELAGVVGYTQLVPVLFHSLSSVSSRTLSRSRSGSASGDADEKRMSNEDAMSLSAEKGSDDEENESDDEEDVMGRGAGAGFDIEYTKQLLLRALRLSLEGPESMGPSSEEDLLALAQYFDVQIVVGLIRSHDSSPATHTHALQLLAVLARLIPDRVLHTIMPVFAFMGSSALKRDDAYTYSVIEATLRQVVPPLLQVGLDPSGILVIFSDAFVHIPQHRQRFLYRVLVEVVGGSALTFLATSFLLKDLSSNSSGLGSSFWAMASALLTEFHPLLSLRALIQMLHLCVALPVSPEAYTALREAFVSGAGGPETEHPAFASAADADESGQAQLAMVGSGPSAFNVVKHSFAECLGVKLNVIRFVGEFLGLPEFLEGLVDVVDLAGSDVGPLEGNLEPILQNTYRELFEAALAVVDQARVQGRAAEPSGSDPQPSALATWNEMYSRAIESLDALNSLLSVEQFLEVTSSLFESSDVKIQQSALELFNAKIEREKGQFSSDEQSLFVDTVPKLGELISARSSWSSVQNALFSLSIVTRAFGHVSRDAFASVLPLVVEQLSLDDVSPGVQLSSLLCIASLTAALGVKVLPQVPTLLPWLVTAVQAGSEACGSDAMARHFQEALLTALEMVVAQLHAFLNPYLVDLLSGLTTDWHVSTPKGSRVLRVIGKEIPPRQLLPALFSSFRAAETVRGAVALLETLGMAIEGMAKRNVFEFAVQVFDFVLEAGTSEMANASKDVVDAVLGTAVRLVLRLNEKSFKPLFVRLCAWSERSSDRLVLFLEMLAALASALKSIFVPYVPSFLPVVLDVLKTSVDQGAVEDEESTSSDDSDDDDSDDDDDDEGRSRRKRRKVGKKGSAVDVGGEDGQDGEGASASSAGAETRRSPLVLALRLLKRVFRYDADGMVNRERYNTIYPLLAGLVPVVAKTKSADAMSNEERLLVDVVGELMVCVSNDAWWKPFNFELLMTTRSTNPAERLLVVCMLLRLYQLLESDYLILLPETVPFLAELTEDEDIDVERATAKLVQKIEATLGHSLSKYW